MYWYLKVARGTSLDEVSDLFAQSSEFRTRYGNLDNADFVELIYQNVLGRGADAAGRDYWVGRLNGGLSRGRVMRYFSESGEYQRETATGVPSEWRAGANARRLLAALPRGRRTAASRLRPSTSSPTGTTPTTTGATTRCEVLAAEERSDGTWFSWWDAKLVSVSGHLDIDHVVALAEAWDSGASTWNALGAMPSPTGRSTSWPSARTIDDEQGRPGRAPTGLRRERGRRVCSPRSPSRRRSHWGLSVDAAEKAALGALLDGCSRTTSARRRSQDRPSRAPKVILYGDSLSMESVKFFSWFVSQGGLRPVEVVWGGTAPCDWFSHMRRHRYEHDPAAVVMQFSGAALTPCMKDRDLFQAYREDARTATRIFVDAGVPVVWVSTPLPQDPGAAVIMGQLNQIEQEAATELGQTYIDAGAAVLDDGHYSRTLPCLAHETSRDGCSNGRIVVRCARRPALLPHPGELPLPRVLLGRPALWQGAGRRRAPARRRQNDECAGQRRAWSSCGTSRRPLVRGARRSRQSGCRGRLLPS